MTSFTELRSELTAEELEACKKYASEATFIHVCTQDRSREFEGNQAFWKFAPFAVQTIANLDSAINRSKLIKEVTLYSGHGNGLFAVGSLRMEASFYKGLIYKYPGFISTSLNRDVAEDNLNVRAGTKNFPVLLEFILPCGEIALDLSPYSSVGEFEVLLPRDVEFKIVSSSQCLTEKEVE